MRAAGPLTELAPRVQDCLDAFVATQRVRLAPLGPRLEPLLDAAQRSAGDGKRLRAGYCYWGWRAAGGDPDDASILRAATALEWLQSSALVHDDIMDASDVRRGRPALHRAMAEYHRNAGWRGDADAYGIGSAILLGDLLLSWAEEMFHTCGFPPHVVARALPYLDACTSEVIAGQFLDLTNSAAGDHSVAAAMRVVRYKAAKYTVERPLHLGAALGGGEPALLTALSAYGVPVGEAFQLRDDVLGVFGDAAVTGKPAGDDLREGKRTVLLARAYDRADADQRRELDAGVGNGDLGAESITRLRAVIAATGALAEVEAQIDQLCASGLAALDEANGVDPAAREALRTLAGLSVRRER